MPLVPGVMLVTCSQSGPCHRTPLLFVTTVYPSRRLSWPASGENNGDASTGHGLPRSTDLNWPPACPPLLTAGYPGQGQTGSAGAARTELSYRLAEHNTAPTLTIFTVHLLSGTHNLRLPAFPPASLSQLPVADAMLPPADCPVLTPDINYDCRNT